MSKVEALLGLVQSQDDVAVVRKLLLKLATKGGFSSEGSTDWTKARLGDLGKWGSGGTPLRSQGSYYAGGTIPWLVIGDLNDAIVTKAATFITPEGLENSSASLLPENTLLIAMYGSIGKMGITGIQCATNQAIAYCKPAPEKVTLWYLFYALKSIQDDLLGRGQGLAQKNISQTILKAWTIPLPPLAEQKRIVAKVDELMALCDRLEAQLKERDVKQAALAKAALAKFTEDPTPENLQLLFHPSFSIEPDDLRRTVLALSMQGKLVQQDAKEVQAKIHPLTATTKPKDEKNVPFELPQNWKWAQLGQVSKLINGDRSKNYPNKAEYVPSGVAWINTGHINPDGTLSVEDMHFIRREKFDSLRSGKTHLGDLVYCLRGATLGKTAIITQFEEGAVASSLVIIRLSEIIDSKYAYRFLTSPLGRKQIFQFDNGSAQPNLSANNVKKYWMPIPPLDEQKRIASRVDQLFAQIDKLEAQLEASRTTGEKLLEAMVAELTSA